MNLAISLLTCDKPELVERTILPLIEQARATKFHLFVCDGSTTEANEKAIWEMAYPTGHVLANVRGGAGAAIVYALTMMLQHKENYSHVGLVESDVLMAGNWCDDTLALFARARADGLEAGAVSARCYADRVLFQRDGYAVCHNLGAGMVIFTRQAAQLVLANFRTAWSTDNRRIFSQLCGMDIGSYWAFRNSEHYLTADWHWDAVLAANGLASLALTPSPVEMIGQNPPLAEQGLMIATGPVESRAVTDAYPWFKYIETLELARYGKRSLGVETQFHYNPNTTCWTYFPHQMAMLGGKYEGDWRFKETRGWGTFAWVAAEPEKHYGDDPGPTILFPELTVPIFGNCAVMVSGGKNGGKFEIVDEQSGFKANPELPPEGEQGQVLQLMVPGGIAYRDLRITALTPGVCFFGVQTRERQPFLPSVTFDHSVLPCPAL
jgi:hypothetical protein